MRANRRAFAPCPAACRNCCARWFLRNAARKTDPGAPQAAASTPLSPEQPPQPQPQSFWTPERIEHYGTGGVNAVFTTGLFLENGKQIVDLLFSGVLPRFPKLRFLIS